MLRKNIKLIQKKYPEIFSNIKNKDNDKYEVINSSEKGLKINGLSLFSKYNPEKEADLLFQRWLNNNNPEKNIIFYGISNPFLIKKFLKEKFSVTIFIPDLSYFKTIISNIDISEILEKCKLIFNLEEIDNPDNYSYYYFKLEQKLFPLKLKNFQMYIAKRKSNIPSILLVKPIYGGSLPIANYVESNLKKYNIKLKTINSDECYNAYNFISNTLIKKENIINSRINLVNFISDIILKTIEEFKPDIIFGLAQAPISINVLNYAKQKNIITAFWFVEDYKLFTYWKQFAPFYDYYFVIQKDSFFEELKKIKVKNFYYLPTACEPTIHKPLSLSNAEKEKYGSTLSFVGAGYYNRRKFFRRLLTYDFKIWGSDWEGEDTLAPIIQEKGRRVTTEEAVKIFNASLININLHSSTYHEGIDPYGDFLNPRTFEIAATKSLQLVDMRKYLPEHFKPGEEILVFRNESELKNIIDDIIKNPTKYENIKNAGYNRVIREHTYENRLKEISEQIGFNLTVKNFNNDSDKDFYLNNFNSLEEIAKYIEKKNNISETETIFLLMKALKDTYLK